MSNAAAMKREEAKRTRICRANALMRAGGHTLCSRCRKAESKCK